MRKRRYEKTKVNNRKWESGEDGDEMRKEKERGKRKEVAIQK